MLHVRTLSLLLVLIQVFVQHSTAKVSLPSPNLGNNSHNIFAAKLFRKISNKYPHKNIVLSPLSIETSLTMIYFGAGERTETELRSGLVQGNRTKHETVKDLYKILNDLKQDPAAFTVNITSRLYVPYRYRIKHSYNNFIETHLKSRAQRVDNWNWEAQALIINRWIKERTHGKIDGIISAVDLNEHTAGLIVNTIYLKAQWLLPFVSIEKMPFHTSSDSTQLVDTLVGSGVFRTGKCEKLDATIIELPFQRDDFSMLIVLPNEINGLLHIQRKLVVGFDQLSKNLVHSFLKVKLPKFHAEFSIDLRDSLEQLGIKQLFTDASNLSGVFSDRQHVKISAVKHKAFIEVDKTGVEAAAASAGFARSLLLRQQATEEMKIDRPFIFAIHNSIVAFIVGHVVNF